MYIHSHIASFIGCSVIKKRKQFLFYPFSSLSIFQSGISHIFQISISDISIYYQTMTSSMDMAVCGDSIQPSLLIYNDIPELSLLILEL